MNEIIRQKIRNALYDILTGSADQQSDGSVVQNMGLNLSNAVRKDGVNIIALQSANIHRVTVTVTQALKLLDQDQIETIEALPEPVVVEAIQAPVDHDNIYRIVETNLFDQVSLDDFITWITALYVKEAKKHCITKTELQRKLGVTYQRLKKILEQVETDD